MRLRYAVLSALVACSAGVKKTPSGGEGAAPPPTSGATTTPAPAAEAPKLSAKLAPVSERAQGFREAADQLVKAGQMLDNGNRNLAEQLFSTAELLVGAEALADVAPLFREGAPPRVTTPTQKIDPNAAPQPAVAGSSEDDDEASGVKPPPQIGSLSGTMQIDGKSVPTTCGADEEGWHFIDEQNITFSSDLCRRFEQANEVKISIKGIESGCGEGETPVCNPHAP